MNYFPLSWVRKRIGDAAVNTMTATPLERKGWRYCFVDENGEKLVVCTNSHHNITNVTFTPKYKGAGLSLKRARRNSYKVCRYCGSHDRQEL